MDDGIPLMIHDTINTAVSDYGSGCIRHLYITVCVMGQSSISMISTCVCAMQKSDLNATTFLQ